MNQITGKNFDQERALYHLQDTRVSGCVFAGPADGESALKESDNVRVEDCKFSLRYPLWHARRFTLERSSLDELTRAPIWYAENGTIIDSSITGVKCLRECRGITVSRSKICSQEFGWKCVGVTIEDTALESEYPMFESKDLIIAGLRMKGKYSFQYTENVTITDSDLDTKDAFWHAKNVTVRNSVVRGEYLGWYSDGLTLINCRIIGTQPLCYCKNLRLIDCTMEQTDLSFEYSDVHAQISGAILSVKNPKSGEIIADSIGEIILGDAVMETNCRIITRES